MRLNKETKTKIMDDMKLHEGDTGSPEVQVGLMTRKISELTEHLKQHKKDFSARRGLINMVGNRSALLKYINGRNNDRYKRLISKLDLRK